MALDSINEVRQNGISGIQAVTGERAVQFSSILKFADESNNNGIGDNEPSDAKIITENFKNEIMSKLNTSKSKKTPKAIKYYLGKLIEAAQQLNGVQKNNLKPNGTPEQNKQYNLTLQEIVCQMRDYTEFVGCGLSVVQDSKTGLYKLCLDNKLYDIPERKVEIGKEEVEDGIIEGNILLAPVIVD